LAFPQRLDIHGRETLNDDGVEFRVPNRFVDTFVFEVTRNAQ